MKNNSGYSPAQKKHVVVWIANFDELQKTKSGLYTGSDSDVGDRIARLREGILVEANEGCFENFAIVPKIGDRISFRGYSGEIYQEGKDYYRLFEDKFVVALINN